MAEQPEKPLADEPPVGRADVIEIDLTVQVLGVSAALIGVCVTILSIYRVLDTTVFEHLLIDELLAFDAVIFLTCCIGAYIALRMRKRKRQIKLERTIDILFLFGMAIMVIGCVAVVWQLQ